VGTPVVSLSAGNSGIGGISGQHLWVEDEPQGFAEKIVELLRGEGWARMSDMGRKLVLENFSWQRSAAALEAHLSGVAARATVQ
jgi:glycosyltransferase involved in cell wall biosynthesis